jgi:hypothetical protein
MSYRKPPELTADEEIEFEKYAIRHYSEAWRLAADIIRSIPTQNRQDWFPETETIAIRATFDKLASPRVYLVEKWLKERAKKEAGVTE